MINDAYTVTNSDLSVYGPGALETPVWQAYIVQAAQGRYMRM